MELADGQRCQRRIGGAWDALPFELIGAYYCIDSEYIIADGPDVKLFDKSTDLWSVQTVDVLKAVKEGDAYNLPARQSVTKVYFAGRS
ncbi:hypothetical protein [Streptomyces sp. B27]|nr:hypothetical protein [Streptomyces sp. B27]